MLKKIKYSVLSMLTFAGALSSCSNDEFVESNVDNAKVYDVVAVATIGNDESRSSKPLNEKGILKFQWEAGDQVVVISKTGSNLGIMTLTDGAGEALGTFKGKISIPQADNELNIYYFGRKMNSGLKFIEESCNIDFSNQTGLVGDITDYDIMHGVAEVTREGGAAKFNFTINSIVAFAHYYVNMPEGVQPADAKLAMSGTNLYSNATLNLANATFSVPETTGTITTGVNWAEGNANEGDAYFALLPYEGVTPKFTVTEGEKTYRADMPQRNYIANILAAGGTKHGIDLWFSENGSTFTLKYEAEGATNIPNEQTETTFLPSAQFTVSTQVPVKEGYKFLGWSETEGGAVNVGTTITLTQPGVTKTIYAVWEEAWHFNDYTLYLGEGGEYGSITQNYPAMHTPWEFYYDENWDSDVPELDGYEFLGWADSKNATEVDYNLNDKVTTGGKDVQTKTVYPVWKKKSSDAGVTAPVAPGTDY